MATLGEQLRNARLEKNVTQSQAAEETRIKVQLIEGLETDDFSRIAAPIYGKGFVKLYAEYLGLDPAPLVAEYLALEGGGPRRPAAPVMEPAAPAEEQTRSGLRSVWIVDIVAKRLRKIEWPKIKLFRKRSFTADFEKVYTAFAEQPIESIATLVGVLVVILFVLSMLSRCVR